MVKISKLLIIVSLLLGFSGEVLAQSSQPEPPSKKDLKNAKDDAKNLANSNQSKALTSLNNTTSVNNIPGYQDKEWPDFNDAEDWLATGSTEALANEDSNFMLNSHQNRPSETVSRDDDYLRRPLDLLNQNPDDVFDSDFFGTAEEEYADCTTEGGEQTINTTLGVQCDNSRELLEETCTYGPSVYVDEDYIYDCDVVREYGEEYCDFERQVVVDEDYEYSCVESATLSCSPDTVAEECDPDTTETVCNTERVCTTNRVCSTNTVCEPDTTQTVCTSQPDKQVCEPGTTKRVCDTRTTFECPINDNWPCINSTCRQRGSKEAGQVATCNQIVEQYNCRDVYTPGECTMVPQPDKCTTKTVPGDCTTKTTCTNKTTCKNVTTCEDIVTPGACHDVTIPGECHYEFDNSCDAFDEGALGCTETGTICTQYDGSDCIQQAITYICEESLNEAGSNVTLTDTLREVVADTTNEETVCGALETDSTCSHTATTCTSSEETRTINGLAVYRDCWEWRKNYTCATDEYENHCTGLEGPQACSLQGETCVTTGPDGLCETYTRSYSCEDATEESEHIRLVSTSQEVVDEGIVGTCDDLSENPDCNKMGEVCVEPAETRNIGGVDVYRDCWKYEDSYQCVGPNFVDNCQDISDTCTETGRTCLARDSEGNCTSETIEYDCPEQKDITTPEVLSCPSSLYCIEGDCDELVEDPSPDFPEGVTYLNILKGIQDELDPENPDVFAAESATCSRAVLGVVNCCNEGGSGLLSPIFGCSAEEEQLFQAVEEGKTVYVGTYCSAKALFVCTKKRKSYCVFDSKLGRIIQEQGRAQLGIDWTTADADAKESEKAENPDCRGLTVPELQAIDFSAMDFSEVIEDFTKNIQLPDVSATADLVQQRVTSFYEN